MKRLLVAGLLLALSCVGALAQSINAATTRVPIVITAGNTFQTVLAAVGAPPATRRSLTIQNNNATDSCWLDYGIGITAANATKAGAILLLAGGSYTRYYPYIPSDELEATCATTSDTMRVEYQ